MRRCETVMANTVNRANSGGQPVLYFGALEYGNGRENIPTAINMNAFTREKRLFSVNIKNIPTPQVTC